MAVIKPKMLFSIEQLLVPHQDAATTSGAATEAVITGPITKGTVVKVCDRALQTMHNSLRFRITITITSPPNREGHQHKFSKKLEVSYSELLNCLLKMNIGRPSSSTFCSTSEVPADPMEVKLYHHNLTDFWKRFTISSEKVRDFEKSLATTMSILEGLSLNKDVQDLNNFCDSLNSCFANLNLVGEAALIPKPQTPPSEDDAMIVDLCDEPDLIPGSSTGAHRLKDIFDEIAEKRELDMQNDVQMLGIVQQEPLPEIYVIDDESELIETIDLTEEEE